jgi:hypothetical protein
MRPIDAPVMLMLDDARVEAARLIALNGDPTCRNTVVVLVVGGGEGTTSGLTNAASQAAAANFERRRPPRSDHVSRLRRRLRWPGCRPLLRRHIGHFEMPSGRSTPR